MADSIFADLLLGVDELTVCAISRREICFLRMYCAHTRVMHMNIFMPVDEVRERAFLHLVMHATYSSCSFYTSTYR